MPFIPRGGVKRPRPLGRPPLPIPPELRRILDATFSDNSAYTEDVSDMDRADLQELLRAGGRYADRRGLSFRHRLTDEDDGRVVLAMWLQIKDFHSKPTKEARNA